MRNLTILLLVLSVLFIACETDFEVNANWKEVTVVYGLLDQSNTQQYIKINKAYLGEGNALQMASIADSVNYNPNNLEVKIIKVKKEGSFGSITRLDSIYLDTTLVIKDDGLFSTDENIIYVTAIEDSNFFMSQSAIEKDYILSVLNKESGHKASGETKLIHGLTLSNNSTNVNFYNPEIIQPNITPPYKKRPKTIKWKRSINGSIYQIIARIYYRDYFTDGTTSSLEYLDWVQPIQLYAGLEEMSYTFDGDLFVNFISSRLDTSSIPLPENFDYRLLAYMQLRYSVGSEDLYTYMSVNEPFEGIVQERPVFSNINNGVGLFSSRFNIQEIMTFHNYTAIGISLELSHLGFIHP